MSSFSWITSPILGKPNSFQPAIYLTGKGVVGRVITDLGLFDLTGESFCVVELSPGVSYADVAVKTAAPVPISSQHLPSQDLEHALPQRIEIQANAYAQCMPDPRISVRIVVIGDFQVQILDLLRKVRCHTAPPQPPGGAGSGHSPPCGSLTTHCMGGGFGSSKSAARQNEPS